MARRRAVRWLLCSSIAAIAVIGGTTPYWIVPLIERYASSEILPIEIAVQSGSTQASVKGTVQDPFSAGRATGDFLIAGPDMALLAPLTALRFRSRRPIN
jgi:hypothetical protein